MKDSTDEVISDDAGTQRDNVPPWLIVLIPHTRITDPAKLCFRQNAGCVPVEKPVAVVAVAGPLTE
jgi:hypothetical protein